MMRFRDRFEAGEILFGELPKDREREDQSDGEYGFDQEEYNGEEDLQASLDARGLPSICRWTCRP